MIRPFQDLKHPKITLTPVPSPKGRGVTFCSLALWERAGVRVSVDKSIFYEMFIFWEQP